MGKAVQKAWEREAKQRARKNPLPKESLGGRIVLTTNEEHADQVEAAREKGLSWAAWARLILAHASGRYEFSEDLKRAQKAELAIMKAGMIGADLKAAVIPGRRRKKAES